MGTMRSASHISVRKSEEKTPFGDIGVDGKIILNRS
jgi:hypothetical protein